MAARGHHGHAAGRVLNAFRHHGLYRLRVRPHVPGEDRCSTPFGITDYIGRSYQEYMHIYHMCAQRLSASRIISACELGDLGHPQKRCSTPFGITDYIGAIRARRIVARRYVLNAFRHHGLYRTDSPANRPFTMAISAQRLSASRIISAACWRCRPPPDCRVLNAFRHHGLYRKMTTAVTRHRYLQCSTPFGITDYIGWHRRRPWHRLRVLNAFRHHGLYRRTHLQPRHDGTPRVLNAFRHHGLYRSASPPPASSPASGAQRLSASRIISDMIGPPCASMPSRVLNAFRHHGLYRSRPSMADSIAAVSAQRLSASRIISAQCDPGHHLACLKCSTPFGITDYIGGPACRLGAAGQGFRCSTPFGITDYIGRRCRSAPNATFRCSTPFGITDYIGVACGQQRPTRRVLNAFRHHGLYRAVCH